MVLGQTPVPGGLRLRTLYVRKLSIGANENSDDGSLAFELPVNTQTRDTTAVAATSFTSRAATTIPSIPSLAVAVSFSGGCGSSMGFAMPPASCDGDENAVGSGCWKERIEGPFRRLDPNPDALELARLALCAVTLVPIRVLLIVTFVPMYYVVARTFLAAAPDRPWAQAVNIYAVRMASWLLLRMLGFWRIDVTGRAENAGTKEEPRVFVSNHISFVEILYFLAELGPSFVMKRT